MLKNYDNMTQNHKMNKCDLQSGLMQLLQLLFCKKNVQYLEMVIKQNIPV